MHKSIHNFVNMSAQQRKANQDKEEWVQELKRSDFDRIHSLTNLRNLLSYSAVGGTIIAHNKNYLATLREDGNFVIYVSTHFVDSNIIWQSNTKGKGEGPFRLALQEDGNVVIYDRKNTPTWASNTNGKGKAPYTLLLTNEGNL
jgi:hypothetical protein